MATITDIAIQSGNKNRVSIFLDGSFFCGLERITLENNRLKIGDEVDEESLARIQAESEGEKAFSRAVAFVSKRVHSEKEVRRYLKIKGYLIGIIDSTVEKMKEYHYLDDEAYAAKFVECYKKKYGKKKILYELKCQGVSEEIAEEAVANMTEEEYLGEAVRLINKFMRTHSSYTKDKIVRYMFNHGFSWDEISAALEESDFEKED